MKTVKVRVNTTIEYEVTLKVMDYYNEGHIRNLCMALEGRNPEDFNSKEIAMYNDVISWDVVDEELQRTLERERSARQKWQSIYDNDQQDLY